MDTPDNVPVRRKSKRQMSWALDVHDPDEIPVLTIKSELQSVRFGLLRLGNTYQISLALPVAAHTLEILPFLSGGLKVEVDPGLGESHTLVIFTYVAARQGRFADRVSIQFSPDKSSQDGPSEPQELHISVEGAVMSRDAGKPTPRRGVILVSEGAEDCETEAGTEWAGFGQRDRLCGEDELVQEGKGSGA